MSARETDPDTTLGPVGLGDRPEPRPDRRPDPQPDPRPRPPLGRALVTLVLAALVPALTLDAVEPLAPLAEVSRTSWVIGVLLVMATAPRAAGDAAWSRSVVTPVVLPVLGLAVALDGDALRAGAALVVALLGEAAARRPGGARAWTAIWWLLFAGPVAVAIASGWGQGDAARAAAWLAGSPLGLAVGPAWTGALVAVTASGLLLASVGGARRAAARAAAGAVGPAAALLLLVAACPAARAQQRLFGAEVEVGGGVRTLEVLPPRGGRVLLDPTAVLAGQLGGEVSGQIDAETLRVPIPVPLGDAADLDFARPTTGRLTQLGTAGVGSVVYTEHPSVPLALRTLAALPPPVGRHGRPPVPWPALLLTLAASIGAAALLRAGSGRGLAGTGVGLAGAAAVLGIVPGLARTPPELVVHDGVAGAPGGLTVRWVPDELDLGPLEGVVERLPVVETRPARADLFVEAGPERVAVRGLDGPVDFVATAPTALHPAPPPDATRWWRGADGRWWARGPDGWIAGRAPAAAWAAAGWPPGRSALVARSADGRTWWRRLDAPRPADLDG